MLERTETRSRWLVPASLLLWVLIVPFVAGCSEDGDQTPGPSNDGGLFTCDEVGKVCNAHDVCAIDPVCGDDGYCRPQGRQDCDDGLDCTVDECLGAGRCEHQVAPAYCTLLDIKTKRLACVLRGTVNPRDPCEICDSKVNQTGWSGGSGGDCDDEDPCSVGDHCIEGVCTGKSYSCSDHRQCTEDVCDGKGGCDNPMKANWCLIDGRCQRDRETDSSGCRECNVAVDINAWTTVDDVCKVGDDQSGIRCIASGVFDLTGCGVCDPAVNPGGWTTAPGTCLIDGACLKSGDQAGGGCGVCDPQQSTATSSPPPGSCLIDGECPTQGTTDSTGCGVCDPTRSSLAWSPVPGATVSATDFESASGFAFSAAVDGVGWQVSNKRAHSGGASLYYGNPTTSTIDTSAPGAAHQGWAEGPELTVPADKKATLHFWVWLDVETVAEHDKLTVSVAGQPVWTKTPTTIAPSLRRQWVFVAVDLGGFAGQTVKVRFDFDSVDSWANQGEGVYIDDVALVSCGG